MNLGGTIRLNKIGVAILCGIILVLILYTTPKYSSGVIKINLRELLLVSIEAAERGGKVVKVLNEADLKERSKGETKEGVDIPVTDADLRSHCIMYDAISKTFPAVKVISEEEKEDCGDTHPLEKIDWDKNSLNENLPDIEVPADMITVWIDPLDATREYTQKLFEFVTTMVCIAYEGNPIIGVIHKPFGTEPKTTWAWLGKGKSTNLKETKKKKIGKNSVIISRTHPGKSIEERVKNAFGEDVKIIRAGGSGYKALEVAVGNVTAYMHINEIQKWDICAGDAIISSLKGSFTALDGKPIDYSASSPVKHKTGLLAIMSKNDELIKYLSPEVLD